VALLTVGAFEGNAAFDAIGTVRPDRDRSASFGHDRPRIMTDRRAHSLVLAFAFATSCATTSQQGAREVKLTLYPREGHPAWTETYRRTDLYECFLKHAALPRRIPCLGFRL